MTVTVHHKNLSGSRWQTLSLSEQMSNIGSELYRAIRWRSSDQSSFQRAFERMLELMDLTIADPRWHRGRRELTRVREVLCDYLHGDNEYKSNAQSLQQYFDQFAFAARKNR